MLKHADAEDPKCHGSVDGSSGSRAWTPRGALLLGFALGVLVTGAVASLVLWRGTSSPRSPHPAAASPAPRLDLQTPSRSPQAVARSSERATDPAAPIEAADPGTPADPPVALQSERPRASAPEIAVSPGLAEALRIAEELEAARPDPFVLAASDAMRTKALLDEASARATALAEIVEASDEEDDTAAAEEADARAGEAAAAYATSLISLARTPDPRAVELLAPALDHDRSVIRGAALHALREGAAGGNAAIVLPSVRRLIDEDDDPAVRNEAFEVLARWGDPEESLAVAQSLARRPGPLQARATQEWIRLERERAEIDAGLPDRQARPATRR